MTSMADNKKMLRDYIGRNPGKLHKVMASELNWSLKKLENVLSQIRLEYYSGPVLKSQVTIISENEEN